MVEYEFNYILEPIEISRNELNIDIYVAGSFNNWQKIRMYKKDSNKSRKRYYCKIILPPGIYEYKFIINGIWKCNKNLPFYKNKDGYINNKLTHVFIESESNSENSYEHNNSDRYAVTFWNI